MITARLGRRSQYLTRRAGYGKARVVAGAWHTTHYDYGSGYAVSFSRVWAYAFGRLQ
jgi:hypothetical protein